jgi:hypothetical protein
MNIAVRYALDHHCHFDSSAIQPCRITSHESLGVKAVCSAAGLCIVLAFSKLSLYVRLCMIAKGLKVSPLASFSLQPLLPVVGVPYSQPWSAIAQPPLLTC